MKPTLKSSLLCFALVAALSPTAPAAAEESSSAVQRVAVGDPAPAIALPDSTGQVHRSEDLIGKKNLVAVFFRGAW
ncbi:MAG: hypothetical protein K0U98_27340 [Deltaproteobacteria bacterium]|nr:hypothetical protein [Deltaproteobacteria bacterium]